MKYIRKETEPPSFGRWRNANPGRGWADFFEPRHAAVKNKLSAQLRAEQGALCCYCEQRIDAATSHIEHLRPRARFPKEIFHYQNLLASCNGNPGNPKKDCCGKKKDSWFSDDMVSPLQPDCEERFLYTAYGQLNPRHQGDLRAQETIDHLGLDNSKLRALRRQIADELIAWREYLSEAELQNFVAAWLSPQDEGSFREFWTTVKTVRQFLKSFKVLSWSVGLLQRNEHIDGC
jgi:uncharacterized protein (TIGR02646 family)